MFRVYWTVTFDEDTHLPRYEDFGQDELIKVLDFMKDLRDNDDISFVTMVSQNPNSVGKPGVDTVKEGYNWRKRRPDPKLVGRKIRSWGPKGEIVDQEE